MDSSEKLATLSCTGRRQTK